MLIIIAAVVLNITAGNCYAGNSNPPPPPPSATSTQDSSTSNTNAQNNQQDANIVDKLFDKAGYQYFEINKEIDSEKNYPKLFNIPEGNSDENDNN